jgi:hypothetical protein
MTALERRIDEAGRQAELYQGGRMREEEPGLARDFLDSRGTNQLDRR